MAKDFLAGLEERVAAAADRLVALREENEGLRREVAELREQRMHADDEGSAAWQEERGQLRERVEALVAKLEELLEE